VWKPKIRYHLHKIPPLDPIQSQANPVHILHRTFLSSILIFSSHLRIGLRSGPISSAFGLKFCMHLSSTYPAHLILLDLIALIISNGKKKNWISYLCNFLHFLLMSVAHVHILSSASCCRTPSAYVSPLGWETWVSHTLYTTFSH